jgi:hypothetical protein
LPVGIDVRPVERDRHLVGGLAQRHRRRKIGALEDRLRDPDDPPVIRAEALVQESVVEYPNLLLGTDEADSPGGNEKLRLQDAV